ncbi:MAG: phosphate regulon sensor histidine kinase PhoR [Methyloceanibacter sp.]
MTLSGDPAPDIDARRWRIAGPLIATVAVIGMIAWLGRLSFPEALAAILVIGGAILWSTRTASRGTLVDVLPTRTAGPEASTLAPFVEALPGAALLLDASGTILVANDAAAKAFGTMRRGDALSSSLRVPEVLGAIGAAADGKPHVVEFTERVPVERTFIAHVSPITASGPLLVTFDDLTTARRLDRMRADFVANASHELRTPLASLSGFIETLQGPARDDPAARERFLAIMGEQAWRMSRLIDDLLSLSRVELDAHLRPETVVDLGPVISEVRDSLNPLARERSVALEVTGASAPLAVLGERDDLVRLFENLVENALKYGAAGKRVEIAMRAEGGEAVLTVRDFGPGIAPEHLPRLTERFYRVDAGVSREQGGTGLGLAIVKHILARHRGRLSIESKLGEGATFTVRLPLAPAESLAASIA